MGQGKGGVPPTRPSTNARDAYSRGVQRMFDRIAARYDRMNRLMTFGRDGRWRRYAARRVLPPAGGRLLDIGAGTGGIAAEIRRFQPSAAVVAADFSWEMMAAGRRPEAGTHWCAADALQLPFGDGVFDGVTSGYLIRNVTDALQAFEEQRRVTRPGGRVVCLDTSPPPENWLYPLVRLHFRWVIPRLGGLFAGDRSAYTYLPESTRAFQTPGELAATMERAGLVDVSYRRFMFGAIAVHVGTCPRER